MTYQTIMSLKLLASLSSLPPLPLGMIENPIVVSNEKMILTVCLVTQAIMRRDQHLPSLCYSYFIVKNVPIGATFTLTALSTSVTIASCMPLTITNLTAQTVEAGDFNLSGG
jgi:hypothetical protein